MKKRLIFPIILVFALIVGAIFAVGALAKDDDTQLEITGANLEFADRVYMLFAVDSRNVDDLNNVELLIFRGEDVTYD
jgi:hypothetical protein